jgi:hypothetical protein
MDRQFCGSLASCFLAAVTFELVYLGIYLTSRANFNAVAVGFVICDVSFCVFLFAYAMSLHINAEFPRKVVYHCMGQARIAGFGFAVHISIGIFRSWEPWGYFLLVWAVTLVVNFVFDFLWLGLYCYRILVMNFMIRSQQTTNRHVGQA